MVFTDIDNIVISDIYGVDYCCNIADISQSKAGNIFKNFNIGQKNESL